MGDSKDCGGWSNHMIMVEAPNQRFPKAIVQRFPIGAYVLLTYGTSWTGALIVAAPYLLRHASIPKMTGIIMFPVMLLGPSLACIVLTWIGDGRNGLKDLFSRMRRARIPGAWYSTLLIPPGLVLIVLLGLESFVSPIYAPNTFLIGILFGLAAGFFEEIGWMGYAFPKLCSKYSALSSGVLLGLLWGVWHLPVIDYLGTATPHGSSWFAYFLTFCAAMGAMRVLIGWAYANTTSVLLAQLMHISSTGALVVLSPTRVTPAQEALWYGVYAVVLWIVVAVVTAVSGKDLKYR